ncbi:glycosyltransferase [Enterobacteriaceae bacterium RIT711]|nr:glycosyltransferase [Enterobacteriaceae bacterium RIT711]
MKFTVLLSLYYKESAEYLYQCLNSIQENTLSPDQVVIVYDGPVGKELEDTVCVFLKCLPIDVITLPQNIGLGKALNHGLNFCKNDIVLRMDTDDICAPDRFEKQICYLNNNPEVVLLGGAIKEYDEKMMISQGIRFSVSEHHEIKQYCKKRNPFNHMTVAFRKSVIEQIGGYQHHLYMEDYNLWLRVISAGFQTHNIDDILVDARAGSNMILRRKGMNYIKSELQLAKLKYDLNIDGFVGAISCAAIRILPRLLPLSLLEFVYKRLRK